MIMNNKQCQKLLWAYIYMLLYCRLYVSAIGNLHFHQNKAISTHFLARTIMLLCSSSAISHKICCFALCRTSFTTARCSLYLEIREREVGWFFSWFSKRMNLEALPEPISLRSTCSEKQVNWQPFHGTDEKLGYPSSQTSKWPSWVHTEPAI